MKDCEGNRRGVLQDKVCIPSELEDNHNYNTKFETQEDLIIAGI